MVSETIKYSDGTETVVNFDRQENADEIEVTVARVIEEGIPEGTESEVFSEPLVEESSGKIEDELVEPESEEVVVKKSVKKSK